MHQTERIFAVEFKDGSRVTYDLCSDSSKYYEDIIWYSPNAKDRMGFEPDYELADFILDTPLGVYKVHIEVCTNAMMLPACNQ